MTEDLHTPNLLTRLWLNNMVNGRLHLDYYSMRERVRLLIFGYSMFQWMQFSVYNHMRNQDEGGDERRQEGIENNNLYRLLFVLQASVGVIIGRYADKAGSRAALKWAITVTILRDLVLLFYNDLPLQFLTNIPDTMSHAMLLFHIIVIDLEAAADRARVLGHLAVRYSLGMVCGSVLGAWLHKDTAYLAQRTTFISLMGSILLYMFCHYWLPDCTKICLRSLRMRSSPRTCLQPGSVVKSSGSWGVFNLPKYVQFLANRKLLKVLAILTVVGGPLFLFKGIFYMTFASIWTLGGKNAGVLVFASLLAVLCEDFMLENLSRRFDDMKLIYSAVVTFFVAGFLATLYADHPLVLFLLMVPIVWSLAVLYVITITTIMMSVSLYDTGTALGLCKLAMSIHVPFIIYA